MSSQVEASSPAEFASGQILVRFRPGTAAAEIASIHGRNQGQVLGTIDRIGIQVVRVPVGDELRAVARYRANPNVLYAEVDGIVRATAGFTPNDPMLPDQWGLARVEATLAWGVTHGSSEIRIAILDTGIDAEHGDIRPKVVAARNFTRSRTVSDRHGHGTHVAGIAAAVTNNARGIAGLGFNSVLMNGKVLGDDGGGQWSWVASGIIWAADNGARVINMSLGATSHSAAVEDAVNYAWGRGVVLVAAAGNDNSSALFYPAAYANVIAVAATDRNDARATFSNFGAWVDVAAPGVDILSTFPRLRRTDRYSLMSGTSMSSPFVAGLAGLVWTTTWGTSNTAVRDQIQATVDPITTDQPIGGRINAARAVGAK
jgi:thermitase